MLVVCIGVSYSFNVNFLIELVSDYMLYYKDVEKYIYMKLLMVIFILIEKVVWEDCG